MEKEKGRAAFTKKRHRRDSNSCRQSLMHFECIPLTARARCHSCDIRTKFSIYTIVKMTDAAPEHMVFAGPGTQRCASREHAQVCFRTKTR